MEPVAEDTISTLTEVNVIERREERREVVTEEREIPQEQARPEMIHPQPVREMEDDWFVLLDVIPREPSYVPPGITMLRMAPKQKLQCAFYTNAPQLPLCCV